MDVQARVRYQRLLVRIYHQVKDYEPVFLAPGELQRLGIQASQVDITDDGILQFNPCFFRPHPERLLEKYPVHTFHMTHRIPELNYRPDLDALLQEVHEMYPDAKDPHKIAALRYEDHLELIDEEDWSSSALEIQHHIHCQLDAYRKGLPLLSSLRGLGSLGMYWRTKEKRDQPLVQGNEWRVIDLLEDSDESSPTPHAIFSIIAHVPASNADQSLTIYENHHIHPILVLSYAGRKHGRIIQASYDGKRLTLQYSQLWSFENDETAPVELFLRYNISQLVGLETSTLCV